MPTDPLEAYRAALTRTQDQLLRGILEALGAGDHGLRGAKLVEEIVGRLSEPRLLESRLAKLDQGARVALGLYALTEAVSWPQSGLAHALECLGVASAPAIVALLEHGLLARWTGTQVTVADHKKAVEYDIMMATDVDLVIHPAVRNLCRSALPAGEPLPVTRSVRQVREADGLEPILRLAALWQRVIEGPLRLTTQGTFYKRDRDRLEDDPVLAGPIADCLEPLPDMVPLWLTLARGLGLVIDEPENDRAVAAPGAFWSENAVHLPQMIATRWLALRTWHEQGGIVEANARFELAAPFARIAWLLWLATLAEGDWLAIEDLAIHLDTIYPDWSKPVLAPSPEQVAELGRRPKASGKSARSRPYTALLEAILLGPAYQLGLVRAAEEDPSGRRVLQLSPLGRYALALGPPPVPRQVFDQFLYVQPNFEVVAYRQGLDPIRIGQLCQFARWSQVGAALELKLTPEWIYHGLEGGLATDAMLDRLGRHSARPVPASVAEAVRTWGGRRDRVAYHANGTLVEFASADGLERALAEWPNSERPGPVRIAERLLLVEDESTIPFHR
ncbi:MAG TPA: hypothetical protein VGY53_09875, partial [Isosphaeraceae bacterium]|nr:hypothetical protein [Isosphaeraceae bacterium]